MKKKVVKKAVKKEYSGDEVKRHLVSLSEDFQHKVSAIGEQFGGLNKKLDEHGLLLNEHSRILNRHSILLSNQSETLKAHTEMIGHVMEDTTLLKQDITEVKKDVQEIKTDLKQKVDRSEFARLERRVITLESVAYGGRGKK